MTETFECGDNPALVGFMYGECGPGEKRAIESHLAICPACTAELAALGATRLQLAAWTPPEVELGFQVVRAPAHTLSTEPVAHSEESALKPGPWWSHPMPAWAQMAAAAAIFAAGLSLGVLRGTVFSEAVYPEDPASTVGALPATTTEQAGASTPAATSVSASDLAALEERLRGEWRGEMSRMRVSAPVQAAGAPTASEGQLLARVRALIDESEQRQQRELALRTQQVVREMDSQRRVDLQNVRSVLGEMEGTTGAEIARQQQTLQYLMRVSQQR